MKKINVLVIGGGGREHAMAACLAESASIGRLHAAPGNPGMRRIATLHDLDISDHQAVIALCRANDIDLVAVGPEVPLVAGLADSLSRAAISVFGPTAEGAQLEGSKTFAKNFMARHGIPTAAYDVCDSLEECSRALKARKAPYVIKADGLAAGKGVSLPDSYDEAMEICRGLLVDKKLGEAGSRIVIEDFTPGRELTVLVITDGKSYRILPPSRDHKRIYEGDCGPNTGGMGAYAPVKLPEGYMDRVEKEVLRPTLAGLAADGITYRGVIYLGLMITEPTPGDSRHGISVVEYNVRFGDPETQIVLPLFEGDFAATLHACADGRLSEVESGVKERFSLGVVLASKGYPGDYEKGFVISGLDDDSQYPDTFVFHAGTKMDSQGRVVTAGGRVLTVTGIGPTFEEAKRKAYERVESVNFENRFYRRDIGWSE